MRNAHYFNKKVFLYKKIGPEIKNELFFSFNPFVPKEIRQPYEWLPHFQPDPE